MIKSIIKTFIVDTIINGVFNTIINEFKSCNNILPVGKNYKSIRVFDFMGIDDIVTLYNCTIVVSCTEKEYEINCSKYMGVYDQEHIDTCSDTEYVYEITYSTAKCDNDYINLMAGTEIIYHDQVIDYVE